MTSRGRKHLGTRYRDDTETHANHRCNYATAGRLVAGAARDKYVCIESYDDRREKIAREIRYVPTEHRLEIQSVSTHAIRHCKLYTSKLDRNPEINLRVCI